LIAGNRPSGVQADDIRTAVLATIASIAPEVDAAHLPVDQPLRDLIDLDSMDWLNLEAALQERLGFELPLAGPDRPQTLNAIVDALAQRRAKAPAHPSPLPSAQHLLDGTLVTLRPIRPDDIALEAAFVKHLSPVTRYMRFMVTMNELRPEKLHAMTDVDQDRHVALVATAEREGRPVLLGVARYIADDAGSGCEFAVAIDDDWHGSGLAGILMQALIDVARSRGLRTMEGLVLRANTSMLHFARQLGFELRHDPDDHDTVRVLRSL
jgi:GNAT superfamily N-acetyltransferase/acyl carrier protein